MPTVRTVLRTTGLAASAAEVLKSSDGKVQPVIKIARYVSKKEAAAALAEGRKPRPKTIKNLKVIAVTSAAENDVLIVKTVDHLKNVRSYNTSRLTHVQMPGIQTPQ